MIRRNCIKFKPIEIAKTYKEVVDKLFKGGNIEYFINAQSSDKDSIFNQTCVRCVKCCSEKQLAKIIAIEKMMNVAKYLNGEDWRPDWWNESYFIAIEDGNIKIFVSYSTDLNIHFKNGELAKQAIDILGEETIRLALCNN